MRMTTPALLLCLGLLAACGADGPPLPPAQSASQPGLEVSGQVRIGITGN